MLCNGRPGAFFSSLPIDFVCIFLVGKPHSISNACEGLHEKSIYFDVIIRASMESKGLDWFKSKMCRKRMLESVSCASSFVISSRIFNNIDLNAWNCSIHLAKVWSCYGELDRSLSSPIILNILAHSNGVQHTNSRYNSQLNGSVS